MNPKQTLVVVILVLLPTALLSLMAARAIRNQELVLGRRLQAQAAGAVQTVSDRVRSRMESGMDRVIESLAAGLTRRDDVPDLKTVCARLPESDPWIRRAYLFLNPWGFVVSEDGRLSGGVDRSESERVQGREEGGSNEIARLDALATVLRRELVPAGARRSGTIGIAIGDRSYCFAPVTNKKDLYAGYEIRDEEVRRFLAQTLALLSGNGLSLRAEKAEDEGTSDVWIEDSISPREAVGQNDSDVTLTPPAALRAALRAGPTLSPPGRGDGLWRKNISPQGRGDTGPLPLPLRERTEVRGFSRKTMLASARLPSPMRAVRIGAFLESPGLIERSARLQGRLEAWGILVLVVGIMGGVWIVLRESSLEIRRAKARSDFIIGISHDLRTPVASMKMLAESLCLGHVREPERRKQFLETLVREADRLGQLIERVLFFVRLGQRSLVYHLQETDPARVVSGAAQAFRARFPAPPRVDPGMDGAMAGEQEKGDWLTLRMESGPLRVRADETALTQVLLNLLDNAVKYSRERPLRPRQGVVNLALAPPTGGVASEIPNESGIDTGMGEVEPGCPHPGQTGLRAGRLQNRTAVRVDVRVSLDVRGKRGWWGWRRRPWARIDVQDYGIGIARHELKKIFRAFYRASGAAERNVSGIGLGLALCRHTVAAHGGWIDVESVVGEGSTFSVYLPALDG